MKKVVLLAILIAAFSCTEKENPLLGLWKVDSKFYKATCEIIEEGNEIKGIVLYYNDDTTVYRHQDGQPKNYFFNNLQKKDDKYIDAISGATITKNEDKTVTLYLESEDTLAVTIYMMHKPIKDIWIRQKD